MDLFGYFIYNETTKNEDIFCHVCNNDCECECCQDCKICCQTLNKSLCCYLGSCLCCLEKIFCCCFCKSCNCCGCCDCEKLEENNNKYKIREMKDLNKIETVFIIYRTTGKCNWIGKIITETQIYFFVIFLYCILLSNMGFEDRLWDNIDNHEGGLKNVYGINGIALGTIIFFYLLVRLIGKCIIKLLNKNVRIFESESYEMSNALYPYLLIQALYATVISGLIYFNDIHKLENIFLIITIGSVEFIKIFILEYVTFIYEVNSKRLVFFSISTIFSFYLLLWDILLFILEITDVENISIILSQFIIGLILIISPFIITYIDYILL